MIDHGAIHRKALAALARTWPGLPWQVREELVQDAWVSLLQQEEHIERPEGWVVRASWFAASNWWRAERYGRAIEPLEAGLDVEVYQDPFARLDGWRLGLLIAAAPERHRVVLEHLYLRDGEVSDLAERLDTTEHYVHQRHRVALDWLREAAGVPKAPRQVRMLLKDAVEQRRNQIVTYFRGRPGWHRAGIVRRELMAQLRCTRPTLTGDLVALLQSGALEIRGLWRNAEYRATAEAREAA